MRKFHSGNFYYFVDLISWWKFQVMLQFPYDFRWYQIKTLLLIFNYPVHKNTEVQIEEIEVIILPIGIPSIKT